MSTQPAVHETASVVWQLRFLLCLVTFIAVEFCSIGLCAQYIILTFFALGHGGGDCELTPDSQPCRQAASDLASYSGSTSGICGIIAALSALALGSYSDRVGRKPLLRVKAWLSVIPTLALFMHEMGVSLWLFLVGSPIFRAFDINGVVLALISDCIVTPEDRSKAIGIMCVWIITVAMCVLPFAGILPADVLIGISLVAAAAKLVFIHKLMPETLSARSMDQGSRRDWSAIAAAFKVLCRNNFILRMTLMLVLWSLSSAGLGTILGPYLTGYLGLNRRDMVELAVICMVVFIFFVGVMMGPLLKMVGQVRALQVCMSTSFLLPALIPMCKNFAQLKVLMGCCTGPMFMLMPIISGIKSNLVGANEQGLVQGALSAICNLAAAVSSLLFGWMYWEATHSSESASRDSARPVFFASTILAIVSWLIALSLQKEMPEPKPTTIANLEEGLLQAEKA